MEILCHRCENNVVAEVENADRAPKLLCEICAPLEAVERVAAEAAQQQSQLAQLEAITTLLNVPLTDLPTDPVERISALRTRLSL